ncbi:MAG: flagellar hook-associated protein 3 [Spirochaetales bacterium]|nr:flagellar hook-associated protein 3 [Spirochaetales bacterium]
MRRISTNMPNDDMQYHLRIREWKMNELNNKMASQTRIKDLRNDPVAAGKAVKFQSLLTRLNQFSKNIETMQGTNAIAEGYMNESMNILQRVRELAVQGGNAVYTKEQLGYMGEEVDRYLNEFVSIANARHGDGTTLFSGYRTRLEPFMVDMGHVTGGTGQKITNVTYIGNTGRNQAEISDGTFEQVNYPGNYVFWAENQSIYSTIDSTNYQVQQDSIIRIDDKQIELKAGDNLFAIAGKINDADVAIKAQVDPVQNSLILKSTIPHEIWVNDEKGTVLTDLGIVAAGGRTPPLNVEKSATVFGASVFDVLIRLRDSFFNGDIKQIGGAGLRGIDDAITNMSSHLAEIGSRSNRLDATYKRLMDEIPDITELSSKETDLDLTQAITDLKMLEYTQKAALETAARIIKPTLLDYLR